MMNGYFSSDELLHKAASYCSVAEHCISEVKDKLALWGASIDDTSEIIKRLCNENFLNESRYCHSFVKDKIRYNRWGKIKVAFMLKQKGIAADLITDELNSFDNEEYLNIIKSALASKLRNIKSNNTFECKAKLFRFAQSRGYENRLVEELLKDLLLDI